MGRWVKSIENFVLFSYLIKTKNYFKMNELKNIFKMNELKIIFKIELERHILKINIF